MCGIAGVYDFGAGNDRREDIAIMLSAISHRGPDDGAFALLDEGALVLGHVRLSIIDRATGHQPIYNENRTVAVVCNGEIYDHEALRAQLTDQGHRFRTRSDSEVIVHLYEQYGMSFLERLHGEFAFLLWDGEKRRLLAVRDRMGVKPLFYAARGREMLFGSEAKAILALPRSQRAISERYLAGPCFGVFPAACSPFEGVSALEPGCALVVDSSGGQRLQRYYEPRYETDPSIGFDDAVQGIRERLERAVRRRMVADVPVAVYLSGGLDSTLVCGTAARMRPDLQTFTLAFGGTDLDESCLARRVAKHYGVRYDVVPCSAEDLAEHYLDTVHHTEGVFVNPHAVAKYLLSRHVHRRGFRVALTGEGADEVFGGYPFFKLEALWCDALRAEGSSRRFATEFERFAQRERRSEGVLWYRGAKWDDLPPAYGYPAFAHVRAWENTPQMQKLIAPERLTGASPIGVFLDTVDRSRLSAMHPFNASRRVSLYQLAGYILPFLGDRVEMAHGVEGRTPFLDTELIDYAATVPPEHFVDMKQMAEKHVLRAGHLDLLPRFMAQERKHPFLSPDWRAVGATAPGQALKRELLSSSAMRRTGLLRPSRVRLLRMLDRTLPRSSPFRKRVDVLVGVSLGIQALHQTFVEKSVTPSRLLQLSDRTVGGRSAAVGSPSELHD